MSSGPSPGDLDRLLSERAWLRRLAGALTRDDAEAEELTQEVYVAAMARAPVGIRRPRAWLRRVLFRRAANRARSARRREHHEASVSPRPGLEPPDRLLERAETVERVARAVLELEEPYRTTVLLRYLEELPLRDVARRMGVPLETARTRWKRALACLRARLDEGYGGARGRWMAALAPWVAQPPAPVAPLVGGLLVKKHLAVLAVLLLLVAWVTLVGGREMRVAERRLSDAPVVASDGPSLRGHAGAAESVDRPSDEAGRRRTAWTVAGKVLVGGRHPARGATVRLFVEERACDETHADADGHYRLRPAVTSQAKASTLVVVARDEAGRTARTAAWATLDRDGDLELRPLILQEGLALEVRVDAEGVPVPGAVLELWPRSSEGPVGWARSDAEGRASFEGVVAGVYGLLARAEGLAPRTLVCGVLPGGENRFVLEMETPRDLEVRAVRAATGEPAGGVPVAFRHRLQFPRGTQYLVPHAAPAIVLTDARGHARIPGIGRDEGVVVVWGGLVYVPSRAAWIVRQAGDVPVPADDDVVRIEVPGKQVRWPLEGGRPVPDGAVVRFDVPPDDEVRTELPFGLRRGRVEDGHLVVDGLGDETWAALGRTEDGLVASVSLEARAVRGGPVAFHRPRTLQVRVATPKGVPLPGVAVRLEADGAEAVPAPIRRTGANGDARWSGLPPLRGTLAAVGGDAVPFSLDEGDTRVDLIVSPENEPRGQPLCIRVRVDGVPRLPDVYRFATTWDGSFIRVDAEDPAQGLLHARWAPAPHAQEARFDLGAPGHVPASFVVVPGQKEVVADIEPGCRLEATLVHAPGRVPWCRLERWEPETAAWAFGFLDRQVPWIPVAGESGKSVQIFDVLRPGRYRMHAHRRKRASPEVVLLQPGETRAVTLDLLAVPRLAGRVDAPGPDDFAAAYVELRHGEVREEVRVDAEGRFDVLWPEGAERVEVVARHPLFAPDGRRGRQVLEGPRADLILTLRRDAIVEVIVAAGEGTEVLPPPPTAARVMLLRDGETPRTLPARVAAQEDGTWRLSFAGYPPGRWTLWCAPSQEHAPLRLEDVRLDALGGGLGPLPLDRGSRIAIRCKPTQTATPLLLQAIATAGRPPAEERRFFSTESAAVELVGLERGRWRIQAGPVGVRDGAWEVLLDEEIEVDGTSTYARTMRLR